MCSAWFIFDVKTSRELSDVLPVTVYSWWSRVIGRLTIRLTRSGS